MTAKRTAALAVWTRKQPVSFTGGKWTIELVARQVEVLATAKGYAMVRNKGCAPFVVSEKDLKPVT